MDYSKIYNNIIQNAISLNRKKYCGIYYEKHHIIPRCIGGGDDNENLVLLTAKEHFLCHKLLTEIYPSEGKLKHALFFMSYKTIKNRRYIISQREYERIRIQYIETKDWASMSDNTKKKISLKLKDLYKNKENHPHWNRPRKEDTKCKISQSLTGKIMPQEVKDKIRLAVTKTWNSKEFEEKREASRQRAIIYHKLGTISRLGKPSKKKGKPFCGDKNKLSNSLIEFYKTHSAWNKTSFCVDQCDISGVLIKEWESHHDAANSINGEAKRIIEVCRGKRKIHKNFKWKFHEDI